MASRRLGVCSWCLGADSPRALVERVGMVGVSSVQLHLDPLRGDWDVEETKRRLEDAGIAIASGMMAMAGEDYSTLESIKATGGVRPDGTWAENLAAARANAEVAAALGIGLVTFHAGFIEHGGNGGVVLERVAEIAAVFRDAGLRVGLETGQESAATLASVLGGLDGVGVNFDPANMVLYGMGDPHEALEALGRFVVQLHAKDALPTDRPGTWGREVVIGSGVVDWGRLFGVADRVCPGASVMIEREWSGDAVSEMAGSVGLLRRYVGGGV